MRGKVSNELQVCASAKDVWAVYSSHELPGLLVKLLPSLFEKIDVEGDGGVGTILHIFLAAGLPEPRTWKEKFVTIDNEKRLKVVRMIEGGYLDLGFHLYEIIFKIIEKDANSCIIRSTVAFKIDDDKFEAHASNINANALWAMANAIATYVVKKKADACNT